MAALDLNRQRTELQRLKQGLSERVERTHKHLHERKEPVSAKFSEQSVEMENQELVLNLDSEGRDELRQIDKALARLDAGTYGICTSCGEKIAAERLHALPFAALCVDCAAEQ